MYWWYFNFKTGCLLQKSEERGEQRAWPDDCPAKSSSGVQGLQHQTPGVRRQPATLLPQGGVQRHLRWTSLRALPNRIQGKSIQGSGHEGLREASQFLELKTISWQTNIWLPTPSLESICVPEYPIVPFNNKNVPSIMNAKPSRKKVFGFAMKISLSRRF